MPSVCTAAPALPQPRAVRPASTGSLHPAGAQVSSPGRITACRPLPRSRESLLLRALVPFLLEPSAHQGPGQRSPAFPCSFECLPAPEPCVLQTAVLEQSQDSVSTACPQGPRGPCWRRQGALCVGSSLSSLPLRRRRVCWREEGQGPGVGRSPQGAPVCSQLARPPPQLT